MAEVVERGTYPQEGVGKPDYSAATEIAAQSVGVYLQPEWAAKEGNDKNFHVSYDNTPSGSGTYGTYTVPAGKTLYICGISWAIYAYSAADGDLNQIGFAWLENDTTGVTLVYQGGNGGGSATFPKPLVIPEGEKFKYRIYNLSNHAAVVRLSTWGYEI